MGAYFRFHVQLVGVKPAIYRRFLLTTQATFHDLHAAMQAACGWENSHLYAFRPSATGEAIAGIPDDHGYGPPDPNAKKVALTSWFSPTGQKTCVYEYDFGDGWLHNVVAEAVEEHDGTWKRRLLDGARAFPPEDCGGIGGYEDCLRIATAGEGEGEGDEELAEWLGDWNPEHFDQIKTKRKFDK